MAGIFQDNNPIDITPGGIGNIDWDTEILPNIPTGFNLHKDALFTDKLINQANNLQNNQNPYSLNSFKQNVGLYNWAQANNPGVSSDSRMLLQMAQQTAYNNREMAQYTISEERKKHLATISNEFKEKKSPQEMIKEKMAQIVQRHGAEKEKGQLTDKQISLLYKDKI